MHFATNKIAPVNMFSIHRSVCDIISQTALKIPQATHLLLAIWKIFATLGFQYLEFQFIYKQIIN